MRTLLRAVPDLIRLLSRLVMQRASAHGITCFRSTTVDCGDAGLALGQAWLAAHAPETV